MNTQNALINLSLIFVLLLTLAFKCGNNNPNRSANPTPTPKIHTNSGSLTEEIVKQVITEIEERVITGSESAPDSVAINFKSISFGTTRTANTADEFSGIPTGASVYPVKIRYTAQRQFSNGINPPETLERDWGYDFYLNKQGNWSGRYASGAE
jgi:hypothetical protein